MPQTTIEDYQNLFQVNDTGRRVLEDMKMAHHFYSSTFDPNPFETARKEGERNVILRILTMLDIHEKEERVDGQPVDG